MEIDGKVETNQPSSSEHAEENLRCRKHSRSSRAHNQRTGDHGLDVAPPRSLGTGIMAARTLMRDEGPRSAVQRRNVGEDLVQRLENSSAKPEKLQRRMTGERTLDRPKERMSSRRRRRFLHEVRSRNPSLRKAVFEVHIQVVIESLPPELDLDQRTAAKKYIRDRDGILSKSDYDIGRTNLVQHVIDTGMHRPLKQPLRRYPLVHLEIIDKHVSEMLPNDVIELAASPWASNVVLMRKANGQLRFCVDNLQLNLNTYKDSYPLPRIEICLDSLGASKFFSSLALRSGDWQAAIDPESADRMMFVTRRGTFRFKVLSFCLTNAPALFRRLMNLVLAGLTWEVCLVYLFDVIVMADTFERHPERLKIVMNRLRRAGLKLNLAKCKLFQLKPSS